MIISEELRERKRKLCVERNTTHGLSKTHEYSAWKEAKKRCYNKKNKRYSHYGAIGIVMCDAWINNFVAFLEHIGNKPCDGQRWSLGRIDNNVGYFPNNVRWELDGEQARNHSLQANNTSGYVGIKLRSREIGGNTYTTYIASISINGSKKSKEISADKYGNDVALEMAIAWREQQLEILKDRGIVYAPSHGTIKGDKNG